MSPALWWLSIGFLLVIADLIFGSFFVLFIGGGALITSLAIFLGLDNLTYQWIVLAISSFLLLVLLRKPISKRFGPSTATGFNEHQGQLVEIIEPINNLHIALGKYRGSQWQVKSKSSIALNVGSTLPILFIDGIIIFVE